MFYVRRFKYTDAFNVSKLIIKTLRETNIVDYSEEFIENLVKNHTPNDVLNRAKWTHFYVACLSENEQTIGCGAIGPFWGSLFESSLFSIFVLPKFQNIGVGRKIVKVLENDEFFTRANRIEVPASKTAVGFYVKMGYDYKNGKNVDEEGLIRLHKFPKGNKTHNVASKSLDDSIEIGNVVDKYESTIK